MKINFLKLDKKIYVISAVTLLLLIVSLVAYFYSNKGTRRQFIYESVDQSSMYIESRYLPSKPLNGKVENYIDELVSGPITERARPLFGQGTKVNYCFENNYVLYVDLSSQALYTKDSNRDFESVFGLAAKNIKYNFPSIKHVEFSVEKQPVFEGRY